MLGVLERTPNHQACQRQGGQALKFHDCQIAPHPRRARAAAMSTAGAVYLMLTFAAACCFPAAAADLPKQGDFSIKFYGHGTWKGVGVGKTRFESAFEEDAIFLGEGLLNRMTIHCFGMNGRMDQTRHVHNFCVLTDIDGDQIAEDIEESYPNGAKEIRGTGKFTAGTGKYTGIFGELNFANQIGLFHSFADNMFDFYGTAEGHYQLPQ
jgi:hypothetical protein